MNESINLNAEFNQHQERRTKDRVEINSPCIMIPVLADGFPDQANISMGYALDISRVGVGFEVAGDDNISTNHIVFGLEDEFGEMNFISATVRYAASQIASRRIGADFVGPQDQLLQPKNILPFFNAERMDFQSGLSSEALEAWENCGVLVETMHDRILVCPQCQSLPTWRTGCPICGSASTAADQLIHHYACAHIDLAQTFEQQAELVCPKCLTKDMVVGSDFEYLQGPHRCHHCGWSDSKLSLIGNCLSCGLRFPGHQALEKIVNGYDVQRLDPLVYLT